MPISDPTKPPDQATPSEQTELGQFVERFEAAWLRGERPAIENYLPQREADRVRVLPELVHIDLECRLKAQEAVRIESYFERFPELARDRNVALDLIAWEYRLRKKREPGLAIEEYVERFRQFREELSRFKLCEAVAAEEDLWRYGELLQDPQRSCTFLRAESRLRNPLGHDACTGQTVKQITVDPAASSAERMAPGEPCSTPAVPDRIGNFEIVGVVGRGGMGKILKGRDLVFGRDVAVKVLLEEHKGKADMVERFLEEARIHGQLQHPGVAPIHELGWCNDGRPYFAMKLVKGRTLSQLLAERDKEKAGPTGLPHFLKIFEQICQAIAYAHARSVIHRDLKPSNIMVGAFGELQVMDWGLAKVLPPRRDTTDDPLASRGPQDHSVIRTARGEAGTTEGVTGTQTRAGTVLGTPAYMSPEQARGDVDLVDQRADVFGLGAILCEILTGLPPYPVTRGDVPCKSERAQLEDAYAKILACEADIELRGLATRCLSAEPHDRPADAGKVADEVTAYQESVARRLREAELQRVASVAKEEEERKRLRVTLAFGEAYLALERRLTESKEQAEPEVRATKRPKPRMRRSYRVALALMVLAVLAIISVAVIPGVLAIIFIGVKLIGRVLHGLF